MVSNKNKPLTLSLVIPVYNEENYLANCLDSIASQTIMPDQVIVVDNNSTDQTVAVAKRYKFVTVLHESNQHQSFAQKTGFNAATSDIIGRIDADSILPVDWVLNVKNNFARQPDLVGLTGGTLPYDMAIKGASSMLFGAYIGFASWLAGSRMLWGANCALRRSAWQKISHKVLTRGDIWEDYDLSFCLSPLGRVALVDDIRVDSSFRAVHQSLFAQTQYQLRAIRTFYIRTNILKTAVIFCVWVSMYAMFLLVLLDRFILMPVFKVFGASRKAAKVVSLELE